MTEQGMTEGTTEAGQIQQEFSAAAGRITSSYQDALDHLRENAVLGDEERIDHAYDAHGKAAEDYRQAALQRNARFAERETEIREDLFHAPTPKSADAYTEALSTAFNADDGRLRELAARAEKTGSDLLARACFVEALERGMGDISVTYLNNRPEARSLFRELGEIPTPDDRERALETNITAPSLEDVRTSPEAAMAAHTIQEAERMRYSQRLMGH
jgi:hypothetical protein